MKSLRNMSDYPAGSPLLADDVLEFHAARLLLLFRLCGVKGRLDSLTKMAKLDFFVRYAQFFAEVCRRLGADSPVVDDAVEAPMVRYHYGPWDRRYYHVLGYLEARRLIEVNPHGNAFCLALTDAGRVLADALGSQSSYATLCEHMRHVKKVLGRRSGSALKRLIYEAFDEEVARRSLGEVIE